MKIWLLLCFITSWLLMSVTQSTVVPEYADLVFLLDSSSNMGDRNFSQMKSLISKIISALSVGVDKYRIGLAQYDDDIKVAFLLNTYKARNPVLNHIKTKIHFQGGSLKTGNALTKAHGLFFTGVNGRDKSKYPPVLVVITSGASLDEVNQPAIALQQDGVNIISVGLPNAPSSQLEAIATTPALALQISNIRDLNSFSKNLVTTLQDVVQNKYALPTGQGTTATTIAIKTPPEVATTTATTIDIKVPPEFTSTPPVFTNQTNGNKSKQYYCEQGLASDMVFLVDTSRHTYSENEYLKNFLTNVTSELAISEFCVHMRIVKFGRTATLISPLDNGKNKSAVIQSLDSLLSMEEEISNIGAAINFTRQVVIGDAKTSRKNQGIEQIAVLVSHRSSADDVSEAAYLLRQEKVRIFTVGIGTANKTQLTQISSYPTDHYLVNVESFENLPTQVDILLKKVENVIEEDILMYSEKTDIIKRGCLNIEVADLYLLIDGSESIGIQGFKEMKTFLMEMVEMFDIGPQKVRVGAVQYSHERKEEFSITREFDKTSLKLALQSLRQLGGGTNTGNALNFTHNIIIDPNNARPVKVPVFLVVLTDGESQDSVKEAAEMLRVDDVKVYAIGVKHANLTQLQEITGDSKKVHFVQDFDGLKDIKNLIAEQICSTEACQDVRADIMFLVESSSNIQIDNFKKMKSFMKNLVEKIEVGPDKVQFGVVQFSDISKEAFQLNKHMTKQAIWSSIDNMNYIGNTTYTGKALSYVSDYFTETKGARKNVKKFLILITDGKACDEVKSPAESLRNNSVIIYSIGVFNANKTQLEEISGKSKRFYLESFDDLKTIENQLTLGICSAYEDCKRIEVADIVFVIDSSGSIHPSQYDIMKDFMISLVNKSNIGPKNVQFGALKYSNDPSELFHLNKYSNKLDIINEIKNDYVKGGDTYTAKALDHSTLFFAEKQGSRIHSGVPQILIILTDGESHDRDKLNETSRKLQDAGIIVYAIGIDKANTEELITMAGSNGRWFLVQNFTGLKDIFVTVSEGMCNNTECKVEKADLVFLIDGSTSISTDDFKIMKNFMVSVINDFDVGPDKVHVGVAQYSHLYNVQFQLKTFMDKITLKSGIENITQIYGNTYIGDALSKTETELFSQSAKSRINEGVHQMLIVITDGNSHDKVAKPAQSLRSKGIDIYALGVGAVDTTQLLQIAGTRDKMITVDNFDKLTTTKGRLVKDICSENIQNNCSVEVVVTFDISTQSIDQTLFHGQSQLENLLFDIFQSMTSLRSPSCGKGIKPQVNVAFHVKNAKESVSSNFHVYSPDLIRNLQKVQVVGPSYLKSSVLLSMWDAFPNKNTGKAKMLLVFTDGLDEDVEKLESTAEDLLKQGLDALVTVGLEGAKNHQDFKFIEFGRGFEFDNQMHIGMSDIDVRLARQLSHVVEKKCCCVLCKCSGLRGSSGKYGRPGMKGIPGAKGQQGHIGEEGEAGERGLPGLTGIPGDKGCPGSKGLKGTIGIAGSKNDDGEPGINGIPGEQGHYGPPGKKGEKGVPGEAGNTGSKGTPGRKGNKGHRGESGEPGTTSTIAGPKGVKGDSGIEGEPGHQGIPGVPGSRGNGRIQGKRGEPGPKGIKGDQGETGYTGKDGLRGPQGNSGIKGIKGEKGSSGPNGIPGPFGIQGGIGNQGVPGHKGKKGEPGDTGEKGDLGPAGERGVLGEDGLPGYGAPGKKGEKGQLGFQGHSGFKGIGGDSGIVGERGEKGYPGRSGYSQMGEVGDPGAPGPRGWRGRKGANGHSSISPCEVIEYVRNKCPCCQGKPTCPAYPTELVFALDMSNKVTSEIYKRMINIITDILSNVTVRESNCPVGARVAVVSFNKNTKYVLRFSDFHNKDKLIKAVQSIPLAKSSRDSDIGSAMKFVARNIFKRSPHGATVRRIAVFFSNGISEDAVSINTAVMEYSALGIIPSVIAFNPVPAIKTAFRMDTTGKFKLFEISPNVDYKSVIEAFQLCTLCFDQCKPDTLCVDRNTALEKSYMDVAFLLDSSYNVRDEEFDAAKRLISTVIDNFDIASQPKSDIGDRVALVSNTRDFTQVSQASPHIEFDLSTYKRNNQLKKHIKEKVSLQKGPPATGFTLQWTIDNIMSKSPNLRKHKVIIIILSGETSQWDKQTLSEAALNVKCQGYAIFVLSVGKAYNDTELMELASIPLEHHLLQLGRIHKPDLGYAVGFLQLFLNSVRHSINSYPPSELESKCSSIAPVVDSRHKREILFQHETQRLEKPEFDFFDHSKMHWISKDQSVDHNNMEAFTSNTLERGLIREEYGQETKEHITYNSSGSRERK